MPAFVDDLLNRITMYRLVLYYLLALWGVAFVLSLFGLLSFTPLAFAFMSLLILAVCWLFNFIFARSFGAATNVESIYITVLILALIISPVLPTDAAGVGFIIFASAWAMASKYILALGKKHIFNPAAFGVALSALVLNQGATWWVGGNLWLLPLLFVGGVLVVRKLRRADLVWAFSAAVLGATIFFSPTDWWTGVTQTLTHSAFFFLAFVMLTEPLTMPPGRVRRIVYAVIVGVLFVPTAHIGSFYFTPELALLVGNIFAYCVSPKGRYMLQLTARNKLGPGLYEFVFAPDRAFAFKPGQYLEWTLPHARSDTRGVRRYFTVASSPTERDVRIGVKFYEPMSSFKNALGLMAPGDVVSASHVSGDFVLPHNQKRKAVFIAGGIGVTPFRSMVQYLLDKGEKRDIVFFYSAGTAAEFVYKDIFDRAARELGIRVVYVADRLDAARIAEEVPDYRERSFYISGPHGMVQTFKEALRSLKVHRWRIKTDFFPGFV